MAGQEWSLAAAPKHGLNTTLTHPGYIAGEVRYLAPR